MTEPDDIDQLRRALAPHVRGDSPMTPDCPDDDMLAAMAEGTLDEERRAAALQHLAACMRCRSQVAAVARTIADPEVAREVRAAEGGRRRGGGRSGWVGVAAAAVLMLLARSAEFEQPLQHRAQPITAAPAPSAVWPVGAVADAPSLRWTPVSGAGRYRIALVDADGEVLFATEVADTIAMLPDSVRLTPGETYWWRVGARVGIDRWVDSALTEFSITGGSQR